MKLRIITCALAIMLLSTIDLKAQRAYNAAVGVRVGETSGLTVKAFIGKKAALDGILGLWPNGMTATLLYERHVFLSDAENFSFYYGAGGHYAKTTANDHYLEVGSKKYMYYRRAALGEGFGVDLIAGVDYKFENCPIAISFDVKPYKEFVKPKSNFGLDPSIGLKFAF